MREFQNHPFLVPHDGNAITREEKLMLSPGDQHSLEDEETEPCERSRIFLGDENVRARKQVSKAKELTS